ncbi:MAG TPA: hypothetical protein DCR43_01355 [Bacteroidales bacterium]|nr:MAG: hypothetical protein A2X11_13935 [Bacteroidetes bacterium GWE2_42_24]OFY28307.1 MAG: hypothetical protein A2X09_16210 [Bacteroidetes bacterium GWF2_43_11]HAQ64498.1 hypothetical protein [Bacteroidales bacterium]HBZ66220.1 hypothetical protein [Bacteroidales bacterium]
MNYQGKLMLPIQDRYPTNEERSRTRNLPDNPYWKATHRLGDTNSDAGNLKLAFECKFDTRF